MRSTLLLAAAAVAAVSVTGCKVTTRQGQIENVGAPGLTPPSYVIKGQVTAQASESTLSPSVANNFQQSALDRAKVAAVGQAIYNTDEYDMVIAPKTEAVLFTIGGIFEKADVTIKGKAVALTGPK